MWTASNLFFVVGGIYRVCMTISWIRHRGDRTLVTQNVAERRFSYPLVFGNPQHKGLQGFKPIPVVSCDPVYGHYIGRFYSPQLSEASDLLKRYQRRITWPGSSCHMTYEVTCQLEARDGLHIIGQSTIGLERVFPYSGSCSSGVSHKLA